MEKDQSHSKLPELLPDFKETINEDKKWLKRIGWGVLIWSMLFVWISILTFSVKLTGLSLNVLTWIGVVVASWYGVKYSLVKNLNDAVILGLVWVIVGLILDRLITYNMPNQESINQWSILVGYLILFLVPVLRNYKNK